MITGSDEGGRFQTFYEFVKVKGAQVSKAALDFHNP
jgi:hypothetical protein